MDYTTIPNIPNKVSVIGLGTWAIGGSLWGGTDETESIKTIHQAFEKGINLIDTAPGYGKGTSEEIVGKAIKQYGKRDQIVIATKCGLNQETENVFRDSRKDSLKKELEDSLLRLQVDYIDLYQIHWPDPTTPISEAAERFQSFLDAGKIRAIGVSNYTVEQMAEFQKYAALHVCQTPYNLFETDSDKAIMPFCKEDNICLLGYSSLCRGLLSGKMNKSTVFNGDDLRKGMDPKFQEPHFSQYVSCTEALKAWSEKKHNRPLIALAVRWCLDKGIDIALWGARKPEQLNDIDQIFGWKLEETDFLEIDKIIQEHIPEPLSPTFMAPPIRK